jgi:hypothetical protein
VTFWEFMYWLVTNNHLQEVVDDLRSGGFTESNILRWIALAQHQGGRALHPSQLPAL